MIYITDIPEKVGKSIDADVLEDDPLLERLLRGATETSVNDSHQYLAPAFAAICKFEIECQHVFSFSNVSL